MCSVSRHWRSNLIPHPSLKTFGMILKRGLRPLTEHLSGQMLFPITPGNDRSKESLSRMLPHLCVGSPRSNRKSILRHCSPAHMGPCPAFGPAEQRRNAAWLSPPVLFKDQTPRSHPEHILGKKKKFLCSLTKCQEVRLCSPFFENSV